MNANDIIEKCAEICDRYALKNHEAAVKAGRRASRLLEIDSAQRETAEIGSVECEAAALEAAAIANEIRALKSSLPAETVSEAMAEALRKLSHEVIASRGLYHDLAKQTMGSRHRANENYKLLLQYAEEARAALEAAALAHADDGWRPIESAPRIPDKPIDLWVVPGKSLVGNRWKPYREADAHMSGNGKHWLTKTGHYIEGRRYRDCDGDHFDETDRSPDATIVTHYRLPAPPVGDR